MKTPIDFPLSQSSLQTLADCPRKFQLRYIDQIVWPAVDAHPMQIFEEKLQLGNDFHLLCQRYFAGIEPLQIKQSIQNNRLIKLFDNFIKYVSQIEYDHHFSELTVAIPFDEYRLIAKFDFLIKQSSNTYKIFDWKTSETKPKRSALSQRFQTILYPLIFTHAAANLFNTDTIAPGSLEMIYWYAYHPHLAEIFSYSSDAYQRSKSIISSLLDDLETYFFRSDIFPLTANQNLCRYCVYRSLCNRGNSAGQVELAPYIEEDENIEFELDIDQIIEISF